MRHLNFYVEAHFQGAVQPWVNACKIFHFFMFPFLNFVSEYRSSSFKTIDFTVSNVNMQSVVLIIASCLPWLGTHSHFKRCI